MVVVVSVPLCASPRVSGLPWLLVAVWPGDLLCRCGGARAAQLVIDASGGLCAGEAASWLALLPAARPHSAFLTLTDGFLAARGPGRFRAMEFDY